MGIEWPDLFGGRGVAGAPHPRERDLSWFNAYRIESARRQRSRQNATTGRCRPRSGDAGYAESAVVCQRGDPKANAKALNTRGRGSAWRRDHWGSLLLEQVLEGLARIVYPQGAGRGFLFDHHPQRVKGQIFWPVLAANPPPIGPAPPEPAARPEGRAR